MTPGFAKPRSELPWLPYESEDRVIINAHNFAPAGPTFTDEVAAWIPTWDTAGNGTTTLNDLIGSTDGVLTSMDPATDWVADTDFGGTRALDYDGSNDFVSITRSNTTHAGLTLSSWVKTSSSGARRGIISSGTVERLAYIDLLSTGHLRCAIEDGSSVFIFRDSSVTVNNGAWRHVAMVATPSSVVVYVDGAAVTAGGGTGGIIANVNSRSITIGRNVGGAYGGFFAGRIDDSRLFHRALTAGQMAALATRRGY
jgi:hypothetical protein